MADLRIFFTLLGDSSPSNDMFHIIVSPNISVSELRELVHGKTLSSLHGIDARNLTLWKVLPLYILPSFNVLKSF
jgi:hypothetical protein